MPYYYHRGVFYRTYRRGYMVVPAPIGAVIGEWVGSSQGLGYLMLLANGRAKTDLMFAALFTLGVLSIVLYLTVNWLTLTYLKRHSPGV